MVIKKKTRVYLIHGILATHQKWALVKKRLRRHGYAVSVLCWKRDVESVKGHKFNMNDIREIVGKELDNFQKNGEEVILISHSAGTLVGGHWINHPAVLGHIALGAAPTGIYIPHGKSGFFNRGMFQIGWDVLFRKWTVFSPSKQCLFLNEDVAHNTTERESSRFMRGFVFGGHYLPQNKTKPCYMHASLADKAIDPKRALKQYPKLGYKKIDGFNEFDHCDYMVQMKFWNHIIGSVLPKMNWSNLKEQVTFFLLKNILF